jgi:copper resistance protein C
VPNSFKPWPNSFRPWPNRFRQWRGRIWLRAVSAVLLALPAVAQAHAILEESTPPSGASIKAGPLFLSLRYNSRIDRSRSRLTLIRPDHSRDIVPIAPGSPPDVIAARLTLTPGAYVLRWQVLAIDGHITRGDVPITVTALPGRAP